MTLNRPNTLRLLMTQWQGGGNNPLYPLGARLMAWLAPAGDSPLLEVPVVAYEEGEPGVENGIFARSALLTQLKAARRIIDAHSPDRLIVFGGDCSGSQAPLSYLNERYDGELGVLWIDRHPDVKTPRETVNLHAMVLGHLLGQGDAEFCREVKRPLKPEKVMFAGLGTVIAQEEGLISKLGLKRAGAKDLTQHSGPVVQWIRDQNIRFLAVHLDVDVLDPKLFRSLQSANPGAEPEAVFRTGEMTFPQLTRLLIDVSQEAEVVGLEFAEHMPWDAYNLQKLLAQIPILNQA